MIAATITIDAPPERVASELNDGEEAFRVALLEAPGGRGTELHASSETLDKKDLKVKLRQIRATIEAGEIATGKRRR